MKVTDPHRDLLATRDAPPDRTPTPSSLAGLPSAVGNSSFVARTAGGVHASARVPLNAIGIASAHATLARAPSADKAKLGAVETSMDGVKVKMLDAGGRILDLQDRSIGDVKRAKDHLKRSNDAYEKAYNIVKGKLLEADKRFELEQAVIGFVTDKLVSGIIAVLLPEAMLVGEAGSFLAKKALAMAQGAAAAGLKAAGGADSKPVKPSSAGGGAGENPGDRFKLAFEKLDAIIDAMPAMASAGGTVKDLAVCAADVSKAARQLIDGRSSTWPEPDVMKKSTVLSDSAKAIPDLEKRATDAADSVSTLTNAVMSAWLRPVDEIERDLWTAWMASLKTREQRDALDNDVIEKYLKSKGMADFGSYTSNADEDSAVNKAQLDYLKSKGITPHKPANAEFLYNRERKKDELSVAVIGRTGTVTAIGKAPKVAVGGRNLDARNDMGGKVGDEVQIQLVFVKEHLQRDEMQYHWNDEHFDVLGHVTKAAGSGQVAAPTP